MISNIHNSTVRLRCTVAPLLTQSEASRGSGSLCIVDLLRYFEVKECDSDCKYWGRLNNPSTHRQEIRKSGERTGEDKILSPLSKFV